MLTATYDGTTLTLYKDGETITKKDLRFAAKARGEVGVGPLDPWVHQHQFHGGVRNFTIQRVALTDDEVRKLCDETKPGQ
jgi:hypothetical protein